MSAIPCTTARKSKISGAAAFAESSDASRLETIDRAPAARRQSTDPPLRDHVIDSLKPVSATALPCKICGGPTVLYGVVDFHKSCEEARGIHFSLAGVPIYYRRCANCKFLFTDAFDHWTHDDFRRYIYNDEYILVDPDYRTARPRVNAEYVVRHWAATKAETHVLDFGGGNDTFCAALRESGFPIAVTYDPMVPEFATPPRGKYDLVTSFETFEHLPDPIAGIASILEFAADPGLIFFTTLLQPSDFDQQGLNWWYVGPRNGHVSLFSRQALTAAWQRYGYKVASLADNIHFAFRTLPKFLAHLQKETPTALVQ